jgi:hypothetical protein
MESCQCETLALINLLMPVILSFRIDTGVDENDRHQNRKGNNQIKISRNIHQSAIHPSK